MKLSEKEPFESFSVQEYLTRIPPPYIRLMLAAVHWHVNPIIVRMRAPVRVLNSILGSFQISKQNKADGLLAVALILAIRCLQLKGDLAPMVHPY